MDTNDPIYRALAIIAQADESSGMQWLVGGSAGLMLRGLELNSRPNDLDLYADEEDAFRLHKLLLPFAGRCSAGKRDRYIPFGLKPLQHRGCFG